MNASNRRRSPARIRSIAGLGIAFSLAVATLAGCSAVAAQAGDDGTASSSTTSTIATAAASVSTVSDVTAANDDQTVVNDDEWSEDDAVDVDLSDATGVEGVTAEDGSVTITEAGVYRLSGTLSGTVSVEAPDDALVVLILDGVDISAEDAPAIQVVTADDAAIFLADGSSNTVSSTGTYAEDADANAAIWSDADLTVSGSGSLTVDGSANDGITSKDDLVVLSGSLDVTATDDGLRGKDSLTVRGGTISIDAGGDGLNSDQDDDETRGWVLVEGGELDIVAGSDGIDGFTDVVVTAGAISIDAEEGIEGGIVAISGGTIDITSTDDGINGSAGTPETSTTADTTTDGTTTDDTSGTDASTDDTATSTDDTGTTTEGAAPQDGAASDRQPPADGEMPSGEMPSGDMPAGGGGPGGGGMGGGMEDSGELVLIEGGEIVIDAQGDGLDSNGSMEITGGSVIVYGPTNAGNGALDTNGEFTISGGTLLALGSSGMAETPSTDSAQAWVGVTASGSAGATVDVLDEDGNAIASTVAAKDFETVVFSSADVTDGATYSVSVDGDEAGSAATGQALAGGMGGGAPRG